MSVKRSDPVASRIINIDGPAGNAWNLMGVASNLANHLGMNFGPIREEMMSGNYINLIKTFDKYFGDIITLETDNEQYLKELS